VETLKKGRRYAIVLIVTIAAFITPPDLFSQVALSVPMYILYEVAILLCRKPAPKTLAPTAQNP
ncbi:MAG: twin-arginine translocase subunit TatC, partial [Rickettsiales bacterium]|nr:twin-arginine translocase subunit TatC [Rickettsiales bacterium]